MRNAERTIELVRFEHNGSVDYKMQNCDEETYPFGEVFDLVVPGSDDSEGIPAFELLDAVVVNEYVDLSSTVEQAENGVIGSDYILDWLETPYSVDGQSVLDVEARRLMLDNWLEDEEKDMLECTPTSDGILISEEDLALLKNKNCLLFR